jgi:hypothetical protein
MVLLTKKASMWKEGGVGSLARRGSRCRKDGVGYMRCVAWVAGLLGHFRRFFSISLADIHAYASATSVKETSRPGGEERVKSWDSAGRSCPVNVLACWLGRMDRDELGYVLGCG